MVLSSQYVMILDGKTPFLSIIKLYTNHYKLTF